MSEPRTTRILYVDDDEGLTRLLQKRLQRQGYLVDVAHDGEAGLAMLDDAVHDVLLVDYDMPRCGGLEVLQALRRRPTFPPVIMVTGNGNEKVAVQAMLLGAADYVVKDVALGYLELLPVVIEGVVQKQQLLREREQMLRSVRESEERYRSLVELSPSGITILVGGELAFANQASADLLGAASVEELAGRRVVDFVRPDYHERLVARLEQAEPAPGRVTPFEETLARRDGTEVVVEVTGVRFTYLGNPALQVILRDVTERKRAQERLEHLAHFDGLTGLPNRSLFFDRLNQALLQAQRYGHRMALLFVDLDRFKAVNDALGHDAGDELLRVVARRLSATVRKSDTVARLGGDEFAVILSQIASGPDAAVAAGKLRAALRQPVPLAGGEVEVGGSIGIALFPGDGADADGLLKAADAAMYRAKRLGAAGPQPPPRAQPELAREER